MSPSNLDTAAKQVMYPLNPSAFSSKESGYEVFIEDYRVEGRFYRLEYQCTSDARHAIAIVCFNPWSSSIPNNRNLGLPYTECHCDNNGVICLGDGASTNIMSSPYNLKTAILRGRLWCTVFSAWMERGRQVSFNELATGRT